VKPFLAVALFCIWGCTFTPGSFGETGDDDPSGADAGAGSGSGSGSDPGSGPGSPVSRSCAFNETELRLCLEFEDRTFSPVTDGSPMRLDATTKDVSERPRLGRYAAQFATTSRLTVPESPALDLTTALTIEMWVFPSWPQPNTLLNNQGQYRMQIDGGGRIGCQLPNAQVWSREWAPPGKWTFIACKYAPASSGGELTVYVDGDVADKKTFSNPGLNANGTSGTMIGELFAGGIDDIRIYGTALSDETVCNHAGRTSCAD